ncbi:alpha/beta hydrolase [Chelatococcus sambhunathii]|uniref:Alpha/beta hydrolase n=1 Tax=Chelatococcus sambhunathii TaxID=363953 RepID=A0ABU1DKI3_9HYPH|nr:alpha/beta hydrolase [Chelatococcus sambhunathii]MDR4308530.1 alpha/beta hydrolase [Chelatococcus sambhunathii]
MTRPITIDPAAFAPGAVPEGTAEHNRKLIAQARMAPDAWALGPAEVRARRKRGLTPFVVEPKSGRAEIIEIGGPRGPIPIRVIAPEAPSAIYLHFHSGGWTLGTADQDDPRLERLASELGFACLSVDYRLAPEHPYPAGPDDCEAAALWVARQGAGRFGAERLLIGGESAGAHLAAVTLVRLRDRHGLTPFSRANLTAGSYDMGLTPSARLFGDRKLVLGTRDIRMFAANFLQNGEDRDDPDVSPLYADLAGLPPAIFTVGSEDPLVDDTLFMAARWIAAGNEAELQVLPGSAHVFTSLPEPNAAPAYEKVMAFLKG